jgi:hypothetical protein
MQQNILNDTCFSLLLWYYNQNTTYFEPILYHFKNIGGIYMNYRLWILLTVVRFEWTVVTWQPTISMFEWTVVTWQPTISMFEWTVVTWQPTISMFDRRMFKLNIFHLPHHYQIYTCVYHRLYLPLIECYLFSNSIISLIYSYKCRAELSCFVQSIGQPVDLSRTGLVRYNY